MKIKILFLVLIGLLLTSCDLDETPRDSPSADEVFSDPNGLENYVNSFYSILPTAADITHGDELSDYASTQTVQDIMRVNTLNSRTVDRWDWEDLRNINYFIENNNSEEIDTDVRDNYDGIARFYRALFYFEKVKKYGDVPWISEPLDLESEQLKAPRDSRVLVMDSVLADINFAIKNIKENNESSRTKITNDVALALKSRITLFEGTYRKYHDELGLRDSAEKWLNECVKASEELMNEGNYNVFMGVGNDQSYKEVFTSEQPNASEVILTHSYSTELGVEHDANWWYNSGTYGNHLGFTRPFINTYLMRDGTPFTNVSGYKSMTFTEEVKNRDLRLSQSIRMPDYTMLNVQNEQVSSPPDFSVTFSGYQPIKWTVADQHFDDRDFNINVIPIFRYAEVLLNYAEAKAEMGELTDSDWSQTIGELRRRAGITGGTEALPTSVDKYLQNVYFPNISDPVILEIRRDRGIELALEGLRFDDIRRWKRGELMEMDWEGMFVPQANSFMDLTGNGKSNVYFYIGERPSDVKSGVVYVKVDANDLTLTNGSQGYLLRLPNIERVWEDKKYLYPLNNKDIQDNPNLDQNPGW